VVRPPAIATFCEARLSRPTRWSGFLFNEWSDDETCCVSHFENLAKVDIFYLRADGLRPSPWLSLPIRVFHDPTGVIQAARAGSTIVKNAVDPTEVEQVIGKTISYAIEVARRLARGELLYAQTLLDGLRNRLVALEDILENRSPGLNCSFQIERRASPELLRALYVACPHAEHDELQAALTGLVNVCRHLVWRLYDSSKLSRPPTPFLRALHALAQTDA